MFKKKDNEHISISHEGMGEFGVQDFSNRSEAVVEIISGKPGFIEKWAFSVFMIVLLFVFLSSWFIQYPDVIIVKGKLTNGNELKPIFYTQSGRLAALYVNNEQQVKKGDTIGMIEKTVDTLQKFNTPIQINSPKTLYPIRSLFNGMLYFASPLHLNQDIEQGKIMGYIEPQGSKYYVEIMLPQANLNKIDTGMQVQLRFNAYPFQEVGFVRGKVDFISKIASDSGYIATVRLDNGLQTNLNRTIQYRVGLKTDAFVITSDMRLLMRMYNSVIKITAANN